MGARSAVASARGWLKHMQFESLAEFFAMGGHGLYVWLAYGATLAILIFSTLAVQAARRKQVQQLRWALQAQQEQQQNRKEETGSVSNDEPEA